MANHPKPTILKNIYFLTHFLYGSGIWGWSNWVVLFWVCHEIEVAMLVVAVVIIWRPDWSWIFFQMIHSHGHGPETVAPHHLGVFKGLSSPAICIPPEWVIWDSKVLQRIFPTQGSNLGLPHCGQIPSEPPGKPKVQVVNILCFMGSYSTLPVCHRIKWMKNCDPMILLFTKTCSGPDVACGLCFASPWTRDQHNMNSTPKL